MTEEALLNTDADARFGESLRGNELPEELRRREDRLTAIVAAKERAAQLEVRGRAGVAWSGSVTPRVGSRVLMVNPRTGRKATSPSPTVP